MLAIANGRVFTVTGETYENGTVLISNGKIAAVGPDIPIPEDCQVIDATGKWVTPGFIDAHSHVSLLSDPQTSPGLSDVNEGSSPITPQVRALDALNPHDITFPAVRSGGFTTLCTLPGSANLIGGTTICFKLKEAHTVFDIVIAGTEQMKMALGENPKRFHGHYKKNMPSTRMGNAALIRETLSRAKIYSGKLLAAEGDVKKTPPPDFLLESLAPVVRGKMRCRIHSHRADDIVTAVRIAQEFGLDYVIDHASESYKIVDFIKENKVKCAVGPMAMPAMKEEVWGRLHTRQLKIPAILESAGVTDFCMIEDDSLKTRFLPMNIGMCMARGMSLDMALRSITINPATLLGIEDRVGSLESGKDADIAVWSGIPFTGLTLCELTVIDGEVYISDN